MKSIKKLIFQLILAFFSLFSLFCTSQEENLILEIFDFRLDLCCVDSSSKCVELCDKKLEECKSRFESENIGEGTRIIVENILAQEKYNNIYDDFPKSKELKPLITNRYTVTKDFLDSNKELASDISKYFYVVAGDILSSSLQFLSLSKAMNEGLQIKIYYEKALEIDPEYFITRQVLQAVPKKVQWTVFTRQAKMQKPRLKFITQTFWFPKLNLKIKIMQKHLRPSKKACRPERETSI